ncbi:Retrovirus-related Pol polyprotein from transposon TNT 1-94 [Vitis vinifera]|uniref:Retrovirus-related Pol polyprotein from transposon TNT 1-94 n=1 Tax=Vitis vinifera TaxID=29760 RepID=A0A438CNH6_VITVI|nr:Retrovirus-related Pol polyprotein from transposon TNT 1-94 [Vitis vinifera]
MSFPPGYVHEEANLQTNTVCRLHKSLYGLKQASQQWFSKFSTALLQEDDIIIASNNKEELDKLKCSLDNQFKLKDLGGLKYFLELEIARSARDIFINQRQYALKLLSNVGSLGCKPATTPMEVNLKLS